MTSKFGSDLFINRHLGLGDNDERIMLNKLGFNNIDQFINQVIPEDIQIKDKSSEILPQGCSEIEALNELEEIANKNTKNRSLIGLGYYDNHMPKVIQRHVLENPRWYTSYTPYQAEIAQGRLEALFNFQTIVCELTGFPVANASLLDEGTAAAEAMAMSFSARKNRISVVQTIAVPQQSPFIKSDTLNLVPEVGSLFREIIETLDNNGEELLADNILFRSNKLGIKSKNFVQEQRYLMSNKVINKYMWITGGVILVNPLPAVDFLATTSVNLQMIMEISKIYEIKLTKKDAKDLATSLLSALAKQGILKGGLAILSPALATSLTKIILSKSIQSVTAGWLIKIVGLSLIEYFKNGQDWGDGGIQEVVDKIYRISKREDFLNNFVKEAISKIEMKKYFKSNKSLPPFTM